MGNRGWMNVLEECRVVVLGKSLRRGEDTIEGQSELKVGPLTKQLLGANPWDPIDPVQLRV